MYGGLVGWFSNVACECYPNSLKLRHGKILSPKGKIPHRGVPIENQSYLRFSYFYLNRSWSYYKIDYFIKKKKK